MSICTCLYAHVYIHIRKHIRYAFIVKKMICPNKGTSKGEESMANPLQIPWICQEGKDGEQVRGPL